MCYDAGMDVLLIVLLALAALGVSILPPPPPPPLAYSDSSGRRSDPRIFAAITRCYQDLNPLKNVFLRAFQWRSEFCRVCSIMGGSRCVASISRRAGGARTCRRAVSFLRGHAGGAFVKKVLLRMETKPPAPIR